MWDLCSQSQQSLKGVFHLCTRTKRIVRFATKAHSSSCMRLHLNSHLSAASSVKTIAVSREGSAPRPEQCVMKAGINIKQVCVRYVCLGLQIQPQQSEVNECYNGSTQDCLKEKKYNITGCHSVWESSSSCMSMCKVYLRRFYLMDLSWLPVREIFIYPSNMAGGGRRGEVIVIGKNEKIILRQNFLPVWKL